jgi:hypothetical protein
MPAISAPEEALGGTKKTFNLILYQHVDFLRRPPDGVPREMQGIQRFRATKRPAPCERRFMSITINKVR